MTTVRYRLLTEGARAPRRMTDGAAGYDLFASAPPETVFFPGQAVRMRPLRYHTGVAFEIPAGHVGLVFPRSSVSRTGVRLSNCVGVIDSDYRGEVTFVFDRLAHGEAYKEGDRIGQIVFVRLPETEIVEASGPLSATARGEGGYGSTGR